MVWNGFEPLEWVCNEGHGPSPDMAGPYVVLQCCVLGLRM